ncbi:MAG: hypothetical protein ABJ310_02295 [Roseobacter sp.]
MCKNRASDTGEPFGFCFNAVQLPMLAADVYLTGIDSAMSRRFWKGRYIIAFCCPKS